MPPCPPFAAGAAAPSDRAGSPQRDPWWPGERVPSPRPESFLCACRRRPSSRTPHCSSLPGRAHPALSPRHHGNVAPVRPLRRRPRALARACAPRGRCRLLLRPRRRIARRARHPDDRGRTRGGRGDGGAGARGRPARNGGRRGEREGSEVPALPAAMQAWRGARRAAAGASGKPPTFDPPSSSQPPPGTPCCVATVGLADAASAASAEVRLWRPSADDATLLVLKRWT